MDFKKLLAYAAQIKATYEKRNRKAGRKVWGASQYAQGLVGDVGDLLKLLIEMDQNRDKKISSKFKHELADALFSLAAVADETGVDLEKEFAVNLQYLEQKLAERQDG